MTHPLRIVALAVFTVFVVSSFPTGAALAVPCDTSEDCGSGFFCKQKGKKAGGVCVSTGSARKKSLPAVAGFPCDGSIDCPSGSFCKQEDLTKPGVCVSTGSAKKEKSLKY